MALDSLKKKVGPLPAWGWGVIVLVVLAYFLFFRKSTGGTSATVGSTQPAYTPQDNSGQLNAAQAGQPSTSSAPADQLNGEVLNVLGAQNSDLITALSGALTNAYAAGAGVYGTATGSPVAGGTGDASQPTSTVSTPVATTPVSSSGSKAATTQPFGGVVSKTKLKNGSTLTTYANGRQVQQAPGKSPYVVKAGR